MARMYSHRRGKSGSSKPHLDELPEWSNTDKAEVEALVLKLHTEGHSSAMIGTILRDQHAVPYPRLVLGRRITQVIVENGKQGTYPEDLMNLMRTLSQTLSQMKITKLKLKS